MPETTERIGKYDVRVAFTTPAENEDYRQRRVDALTAWLLAQWEAQRKEDEHGDAHAAGYRRRNYGHGPSSSSRGSTTWRREPPLI